MYRYPVMIRGVNQSEEGEREVSCRYQIGDEVWIKPPGARCDERYKRGKVTKILSEQAVEIDGVPRHIKDLRCNTPSQWTEEKTAPESEDEKLLIGLRGQADVSEEQHNISLILFIIVRTM